MRLYLSIAFILLSININLGQLDDSLIQKIFSSQLPDSQRFEAILHYIKGRYNYDSLYHQVIHIADSLASKGKVSEGKIAKYYNSKSIYLNNTDQYDSARSILQRALKIFKQQNNLKGVAMVLGNMGNSYYLQGDLVKCLNYLLEAQQYLYQTGDSALIAIGENNIANVYYELKDTLNALKGYKKVFNIAQKLKNNKLLALSSVNLGSVYYILKKTDSAKLYYKAAIKYGKPIKFLTIVGDAYQNIGNIYLLENQPDSAIKFLINALTIYQKINNRSGLVHTYLDLALYHTLKYNIDSAHIYIKKSEILANQIRSKKLYQNLYKAKYRLDSIIGNYPSALHNYILYIQYRDSIVDAQVRKQIANLKSKYELELKERENQILKERELRQRTLIRRQKTILILVIIFSAILLLMLLLLYRSYKIIRRINCKLQIKNREVEQKNRILSKQKEQILEQNKKITEQHQLLLKQQKNLEDSMYLAADLQRAMLPDLNVLSQFFAEWFIFYKPRDIVSGDFYWIKKISEHKILIAIGDCTGHGIPGALLSVLSIALLNETFSAQKDITAANALNIVREKMKKVLRQNSSSSNYTGLDMALIIYDKAKLQLNFAGAFRPLYLIQANILNVYTGDKQPVGAFLKELPFTDHFAQVNPGDMIYLFTDGYPDLYSWTNKKFTVTRLKKLFLDIHTLPVNEQKRILQEMMDKWKGKDKQMDDILIAGFRI